MDAKTVGAVATLTGVSVRTLHHYDHIGLVLPSVRTPAGYRGYTDADIERLHLVLVYRSFGLALDEIRTLLDDADADVVAHLQRQHALLTEQAERLQDTIKAVEELMSAHRSGIQLTADEQIVIFGTTAFSVEYTDEAEERWGDTEAWAHWVVEESGAVIAHMAVQVHEGLGTGRFAQAMPRLVFTNSPITSVAYFSMYSPRPPKTTTVPRVVPEVFQQA